MTAAPGAGAGAASIVVLVGNPQPASRTRLVAEEVARQIAERAAAAGADAEIVTTIDLAERADALFRFPDAGMEAWLATVAAADVLVVASPTYKASYTGMLKAFLDRYPTNGLAGVTAVPVMTIGGPAHTLAVDTMLRPLLVELDASVPTRGIAFTASAVDERADRVSAWLDDQWSRLAAAAIGVSGRS